jgi:hypothetical protein
MADDGGVLGNLPHSRPGQRSDKRTTKAAKPAQLRSSRARSATGARRRAGTTAGQKQPSVRQEAAAPSSPVGAAVRAVTSLPGTGVRLAHGVAREVLRRIPRP